MDRDLHLGADLGRAVQEGVERVDDAAADAVFDGDQAVVDVPADDFLEDAGDVGQRDVLDAAAELPHATPRGENVPVGPEEADPQRLFQRERPAHQLAIDRLQAAVRQRPVVEPAHLLQHRLLAVGRIDRRRCAAA